MDKMSTLEMTRLVINANYDAVRAAEEAAESIATAVDAVAEAFKAGHTELTEEILAKYMYTGSTPDPDLVIRTGGDKRISNFLLWQSAYSEYVILDTLWPDMNEKEVMKCVKEFYTRNRRFGGLNKGGDVL